MTLKKQIKTIADADDIKEALLAILDEIETLKEAIIEISKGKPKKKSILGELFSSDDDD